MFIVHVLIDVKEEFIEEFREASIMNVENSLKEEGVRGFELLQNREVPTQFMLVEQYYNQDAQLAHRETAHYAKWKATITDMLEKPYTIMKFENVKPTDSEWKK